MRGAVTIKGKKSLKLSNKILENTLSFLTQNILKLKKAIIIIPLLILFSCASINQGDGGMDKLVHENVNYTKAEIEDYLTWMGYSISKKKENHFIASKDIIEDAGSKLIIDVKKYDKKWIFTGAYSSVLYFDENRNENVYSSKRVFSKSKGNEYYYGWLNLGRFADGLKMKYGN